MLYYGLALIASALRADIMRPLDLSALRTDRCRRCGKPVVATSVGDLGPLLDGLPGCALVPESAEDRMVDALASGLAEALENGPVDARDRLLSSSSEASAARVWEVWRRAMQDRGRLP